MDEQLYAIVDYILNKAPERYLDVIREALRRRLEDTHRLPMEYDPKSMAAELAARIDEQVLQSVGSIKESVRDYVASLIRKNVPDIPEEHVEKLLEEWVPDPPGMDSIGESDNRASSSEEKHMPGEMLLTMISQFISYSTETMSASEQARLEEEMPGWKERYWSLFPEKIRRMIRGYLRGEIGSDACWQGIRMELGL